MGWRRDLRQDDASFPRARYVIAPNQAEGHDVERINNVNIAILIDHSHIIFADSNKLRMWNIVLLPIRCSEYERPKPCGQTLSDFLRIHT